MKDELIKSATRAEKEQALDSLARELAVLPRNFQPHYPWVVVRVLPREQRIGSIVTPEKQNKIVIEGIVLATWQGPDNQVSALHVGEHVLFPYYAGLPLSGYAKDLSDARYRIVKECDWEKAKEGGIFATVEYDDNSSARLRDLLDAYNSVEYEVIEAIAVTLEENYELIDKTRTGVTLSGT